MRIIELFAGIGACSTALKRLGKDIEIVDAVEIDKCAIASFNAIHGTNFETQDITIWDKDFKDIDLITHGSPCQDFSVAGKQAGGDIGSGTRSSLMYETIRIVGKIRPKYVLWENVKNILSKKHKHNFDAYVETMKNLGYNSFYEVLNAKDYGIPQNRERVYTISIRKDIPQSFYFPEKEELKLRLKDMLEERVDEKYYLTDSMIKTYQRDFGSKGKELDLNSPIPTLTASMGTGGENIPILKQYGELFGGKWDKINESCRRVYSEEGLSPTIHTCQGGNTEPKVATYSPYVNKKYEEFIEENGYVPEMFNPYNKSEITDVAPTLTAQGDSITKSGTVLKKENFKIRKLTPKECWRLMGFSDEDFEKAQSVPMSNTQLYKQAGNSIVVNVLEKIFKNLFEEANNE